MILTRRQTQVLVGISNGLCAKEIASKLGISEKTAWWHRNQIANRLGIGSDALLTRFAIRSGLIKP